MKEIEKAQNRTESYEEMALRKHHAEIDISLGKWDEEGKVNHDTIACYTYDFTYFMTKDQLADYVSKEEKELASKKGEGPIKPLVKPVFFELETAKRVYTTKDMLKAQEEAEKMEEAQ